MGASPVQRWIAGVLTGFFLAGGVNGSRGDAVAGGTVVVDNEVPGSTMAAYALKELLDGLEDLHGVSWAEDEGAGPALTVRASVDPEVGRLSASGGEEKDFEPDTAVVEIRRDFGASGRVLEVTGASERGVCLGLLRLNAMLYAAWARDRGWPPDGRWIRRPLVPLRGIYTHLLYAHAHPWAPRRWSEEEHGRYLEMLGSFGYNVSMTTPGIGIMETPLTDLDREGLAFFVRLEEQARRDFGMRFWPGDAANEITEEEPPLPIFERGLGGVRWVDPGDPGELKKILDNREELFRYWPDLAAFWVIDGDPGGYPGSTAEEFAALLLGLRERMDRARPEGKRSALVYWQWTTWSPELDENTGIPVLRMLAEKMGGPWYVMVSNGSSLHNAAEAGCLDRAIYFPYHLVEFEPHGPFTNPRFDDIRREVNRGIEGGAKAGSFCNAMSPLIQLPNIAYYQECLWNPVGRQPEGASVMRFLAAQIVPEHAEILAAAWLALQTDPASPLVGMAREKLDNLLNVSGTDLGRIGPVGRRWFPSVRFHLERLREMLGVHEKAGPARDAIRADGFRCRRTEDALVDYIRAYLEWNRTTGYGHPRRLLSGNGYHWINYEMVQRVRSTPDGEAEAREMLRRVEARCRDLDPALAAAAVRQISRGVVSFDDPESADAAGEWRTGDILVIDVGGEVAEVVRGMTHSPYTHCGIVVRDDGRLKVVEAVDPVREIPLEDFLGQAREGRFVHLRVDGLSDDRATAVVEEARGFLGRRYDDRFEWDDDRIYCSELVYKAFQRGAGVALGTRHRIRDLDWKPYEEFIRSRADGDLPLERELITPAELVRTPATRILQNTFPH